MGKLAERWLRDGFVRHPDQLPAASAHLDGDVAKGGSVELETRRLAMIGAAHGAQLPAGALLELPHGGVMLRGGLRLEHEIILA